MPSPTRPGSRSSAPTTRSRPRSAGPVQVASVQQSADRVRPSRGDDRAATPRWRSATSSEPGAELHQPHPLRALRGRLRQHAGGCSSWRAIRLARLGTTRSASAPGGEVRRRPPSTLLGLLALIGASPAGSRGAAPRWLWAMPLLYALSIVPVNVETPRFREPIDAFLLLLAACALSTLWERLAGREIGAVPALTQARRATARRPAARADRIAGARPAPRSVRARPAQDCAVRQSGVVGGRPSCGSTRARRGGPAPGRSRPRRRSAASRRGAPACPVSLATISAKPSISVPPPASRIPSRETSEASSGGVCSSVSRIACRISRSGAAIAVADLLAAQHAPPSAAR